MVRAPQYPPGRCTSKHSETILGNAGGRTLPRGRLECFQEEQNQYPMTRGTCKRLPQSFREYALRDRPSPSRKGTRIVVEETNLRLTTRGTSLAILPSGRHPQRVSHGGPLMGWASELAKPSTSWNRRLRAGASANGASWEAQGGNSLSSRSGHAQLSANHIAIVNIEYTGRRGLNENRHEIGSAATAGTVIPDETTNFDQMDNNCRACTSDLMAQ